MDNEHNTRGRRESKVTARELAREERKAEWEKLRRRIELDAYGDPVDERNDPVDGRRLADDLRRMYALTRDPVFEHAAEVLKAFGLDRGSPKRSAGAVAAALVSGDMSNFLEWCALEEMLVDQQECERIGKKFSVREAAEKAVVNNRLPGISFEATVDDLRKKFGDAESRVYQRPADQADTGRRLFAKPVGDEVRWSGSSFGPWLARDGEIVPDTALWRELYYSGKVTVKFLGENYPPNKSQT